MSHSIITRYFDAFNAGDSAAMIALVAPDVAHHVNEGAVRTGIEPFTEFCAHMGVSYRETLTDIVVLEGPEGRFAAEYIVNGVYLKTDDGLPEARGQTYRLPAGSFFTVQGGRIARIVTYYNLADWIRQVT
jgi:steroid delta-isomerase-like uncharacterized protein